MGDIRLAEWLTIAAIVLGPIFALQAQRHLEKVRERRQQRLNVFYTLMATRAARLSREHIQALNSIDLVFYGRRIAGRQLQNAGEKAVANTWRAYSDYLNSRPGHDRVTVARWVGDGDQPFTTLLYEMSRSLGYDFDEVQLKRCVGEALQG